MTSRRIEPLVWLTFSAGGVTAAMFFPVTFLVLLGMLAVTLLHAAHRFSYALYDGLQLKWKCQIAVACYGAAL